MSKKYALIIGNTEYTDPGLAQLTAPGKDAEDFGQVLKAPDYGGFDEVHTLINQDASTTKEAIEEFFNEKTKDDLLLLYFSGHGVKDEVGNLYLAVKNTKRTKLRSTGIESEFVRAAMDQSRSKRQVLILDCCNSGAFAQGTKAEAGGSVGTASAFHAGSGQIILTASDATQFAWEGDKVIGETTDNSLFTHFLMEGLKGGADRDGDGEITVTELYDYAYEQVRLATPKQTPSKFSNKQQGEITIRQGIRIEDIKPVPLDKDVLALIESPSSSGRLAAVTDLTHILKGKNLGKARAAREALQKLATEDDSGKVKQAARQALEEAGYPIEQGLAAATGVDQPATRTAQLRREHMQEALRLKAEQDKLQKEKVELEERLKEERSAREKIETDQLTKQKAEENRLKAQAETERKAKEKVAPLPVQPKIELVSPAVTAAEKKSLVQPTIAPSNKSPIGALALSMLVLGGMGQIYLGQQKKGIVLMVTTFITSFFLVGALIYLYGAIDAYAIAQKMEAGHSVKEWEFGFSWKATLIAVPVFLVILVIAYLVLLGGM